MNIWEQICWRFGGACRRPYRTISIDMVRYGRRQNPSHFLPAWLVLGGYPSETRLEALCTVQRVIDYLSEASPVQADPGNVRTHLEGLSTATLRAWLYMLFSALSGKYGRSYTLHVNFDCVPSSTVCDRFFFYTEALCSYHQLTDTFHYSKIYSCFVLWVGRVPTNLRC